LSNFLQSPQKRHSCSFCRHHRASADTARCRDISTSRRHPSPGEPRTTQWNQLRCRCSERFCIALLNPSTRRMRFAGCHRATDGCGGRV